MGVPATVRVQHEDFDVGAEVARLKSASGDVGAIVTFSGVCRSDDGRLESLELEHYPGMAEGEIGRIVEEASGRWPLAGVTVIHRFGRIPAGDNIVLVATASRHRQAAFEAASFLMDFMKNRAPFWKKEHPSDAREGGWVAAKESDDSAAKRWR